MFKVGRAWWIGSLAVVVTGCSMCQHPYDYCGPTFPNGCPTSGFVRAGSVLSVPPNGSNSTLPPSAGTVSGPGQSGGMLPVDGQARAMAGDGRVVDGAARVGQAETAPPANQGGLPSGMSPASYTAPQLLPAR
jgi:hypothetical protein